MIEKERLIKAPTITAEEVADDDYIMIDSPTLGVRKYLASNLLPQPIEYLYKWDFTKEVDPLIDEVQKAECELFGNSSTVPVTPPPIAIPSFGVKIEKPAQYIKLPINELNNRTIEIIFGEMVYKVAVNHGRLFMYSNEEGLIFRASGGSRVAQWQTYIKGGWRTNLESFADYTEPNIFNNSILKVTMINNKPYYYRDSDLIYFDNVDVTGFTELKIGSTTQSFYDMVIKEIRIYENI